MISSLLLKKTNKKRMKPIFLVLLYPFLIFGETQNDQYKTLINDLDLKMNVNTFFIDKIIKDDNTQ